MTKPTITYHGVLAGAYKGGIRSTLTHASVDQGITALCGKVKEDALCDWEEPAATCPACLRKAAKLG